MLAFKKNAYRVPLILALILVLELVTLNAQQQDSTAAQRSAAPAKLQPLNVKTGLWETTATYSMAGELPVAPEMLNRMTPQQRARLEQAMKAESGNAKTMTYQGCLKKEDLEHPNFTDKKQCTWTTLESSSTKVKGSASCVFKDPEMSDAKVNGSGEFVAIDQEHVKGSMHMKVTGAGHEMNSNSTFASRWLKSDCGGVQ
jgi:hypothetical protein